MVVILEAHKGILKVLPPPHSGDALYWRISEKSTFTNEPVYGWQFYFFFTFLTRPLIGKAVTVP